MTEPLTRATLKLARDALIFTISHGHLTENGPLAIVELDAAIYQRDHPIQLPASPPGDTLRDILRERGWTQHELGERTGVTQVYVSQIACGQRAILPSYALQLERILGGPTAEFWLKRQSDYDLATIRNREHQ